MRFRHPIIAERPWIATALVIAGVVHIMSILAMPRLAPNDGFTRLMRAVGTMNEFHAVARAAPGSELVPYNDPAVATGVCPYDLADGPLHVRAKLSGEGFASLSFHSRHGVVFYSLTDRAATRQGFDVYVMNAAQLAAMQARDTEDEPPQDARVVSPEQLGFVLARVLSPQSGMFGEAEAQVAAFNCVIEPIPAGKEPGVASAQTP